MVFGMTDSAIVLANGLFRTCFAKTAHGLVRGPSRFDVLGVVDPESAGEDAGLMVDGRARGIPVRASLREHLDAGARPSHCVLGVATEGGSLPPALKSDLEQAARAGLTLVNGLHQLLAADEQLTRLVSESGGSILDLRQPRPVAELSFWSGEILKLQTPRVAVLGTDCALGKRTTGVLLRDGLRVRGTRAEMVYTGQTGWLQGLAHGFFFDATPNDFVSGELERAVLECAHETAPEVILLEGQSSLRNPSGPAGSELIISAGARGVILQHAPDRRFHEGFESQGCEIRPLKEEIELIRILGAEVWALALNEAGMDETQAEERRAELEQYHGMPVVAPLRDGLDRLVDVVRKRLN